MLICEKVKSLVTEVPHAWFSEFLRNIKVWAHSRQIYEQRYCYLGGISWAILCANVCQKFPLPAQFQPSQKPDLKKVQIHLLHCFFKLYSRW